MYIKYFLKCLSVALMLLLIPFFRVQAKNVNQKNLVSYRINIPKSLNMKPHQKSSRVKIYPTVNNANHDLHNHDWEATGYQKTIRNRPHYKYRVHFKHLKTLPYLRGTRSIQSIAIDYRNRDAYMGFDVDSRDTRIAKYSLKRNRILKVGKTFTGGHGQALAYDPKLNQLWLLVDNLGPMKKGRLEEIGTNRLLPVRHHQLRFGVDKGEIGDVLAFDTKGRLYSENRIWPWDANKYFKDSNMALYRGVIKHHFVKFRLIKPGIRHSPGYIIQGMAYGPTTKRLYMETDGAVMSIPVNKLGHLKAGDVRDTVLDTHHELEGISFDKAGRTYILSSRPIEVMRSVARYFQ